MRYQKVLEDELEYAIKLHAEYHMGRSGLSDKAFAEVIKKLFVDFYKEQSK